MADLAIGRFVSHQLTALVFRDPDHQQSDISSRQHQQTHLRSASTFPLPHATARHNLATSFTRALSEPKPIAAHQLNASMRAWTCVQTCFASDPQCQTAREQRSEIRCQTPASSAELSKIFRLNRWKELVGQGRFELPTSRLSSARSNQLSY
jgi:hypothetical protein